MFDSRHPLCNGGEDKLIKKQGRPSGLTASGRRGTHRGTDKERNNKERQKSVPVRVIIIGSLILVQIVMFIVTVYFLSGRAIGVYAVLEIISIVIVIYIVNQTENNPSYKLTWIIFILALPLIGGIVYLVWGGGRVLPHMKKRMRKAEMVREKYLKQDPAVVRRLDYSDMYHARQSHYLSKESGYPLYSNTSAEYISPCDALWPRILEELERAESYIFMEFFILAQGKMWDSIHQILIKKAACGLDIRIMFDDFGSIGRQYRGFEKGLRAEGIKVSVFNPLRPSVNVFMNNRNHRKMIIIDGKTVVTGGFNIGDEYVNLWQPYGHWMDNGLILKGDAVRSYLVMFSNMWCFTTRKKMDLRPFLAPYEADSIAQKQLAAETGDIAGIAGSAENPAGTGFIQPYCDGPLNDKNPAEGLYMQILNTAQHYVYIVTPYLVLNNEMITVLCLASNAGIDVRIITPSVWDKWYVHPVTQYNYEKLLKNGVRIYEYTPGFVHSKIFISDDKVATIGTVNMDYRSLYFHFECGTWLDSVNAVLNIRDDVLSIMASSEEILLENWVKRPIIQKFKQSLLHLFAPFL